jgi:RimJ/RimL family protein N-acetyltransferase
MSIRTERLEIEPRVVEHAAELCDALADESVGRYLGGPDVTTVEAMIERITYVAGADASEWGERWLNWVVRLAADPARPLIGRIESTVHIGRHPRVAEIAYVFGPAWSGHGYATEATAWMLEHLRDEHGAADAFATVDPENVASIRLLERLGFERCEQPAGGLGSYDAGDLVFGRSLA